MVCHSLRGWISRSVICAASAGLALLAVACDAAAQEEPDGVALFEQARFEEAQAWFQRVLAAPNADDAALARAHLYLAALALATNDSAAAEAHAAAAAALFPAATAPPGAPPELDSMLRLAASTLPRGGLAIEIDGPECRERREQARVTAALTTAPPALTASLTLRCEAGDETAAEVQSRGATAELEVGPRDLAPGRELACRATAHTASGVTLRTAELQIPPCGGGQDWRQRMTPWGWVGVGGGAALVTVAIVLAAVLSRPDTAELGAPELVAP
jgi:hypothetical protein